MRTECNTKKMEFHGIGRRTVIGEFDGGKISSDGGGVLLREVEQRTHILKRLAGCFTDHRDPALVEHTLESLINQRVIGIGLGYEDEPSAMIMINCAMIRFWQYSAKSLTRRAGNENMEKDMC